MGCLLLAEHLEWFPTERALVSDAYWNIKQVLPTLQSYELRSMKSCWAETSTKQMQQPCVVWLNCSEQRHFKPLFKDSSSRCRSLKELPPEQVHFKPPPDWTATWRSTHWRQQEQAGESYLQIFSPWDRSLCKGQSDVSTHLQSKVLNVSAYKCFHNKEM